MKRFAGYKTIGWNVIKIIILAPLIAAGVLSPDEAGSVQSSYEGIWAGVSGLFIIGDIVLRKLTTGPMGKIFHR